MSRQTQMSSAQILDRKLPAMQQGAAVLRQRPVRGWIRSLREAMGMSLTVLAHRLGVSHSAVVAYEKAEITGRMQTDTLQRIAEALDAELIIALVPRRPIYETLRERARYIAQQEMSATVRSMHLEAQAVDPSDTQAQFEALVDALVREPKRLWR